MPFGTLAECGRVGGGARRAGAGRRKKEAREVHKRSQFAQNVQGLRAKLYHQQRFKEKVQMKKTYVDGGRGARGGRGGGLAV